MTAAAPDVATLAAVRDAYARGKSPADVIDAALARIAASPDPAAWITLRPRDELLAEARALRPAGRGGLPLWGVPFAVKDNIDCAGLPTTCAFRPRAATAAARDAFVVARLRAAGAIPLGKTNLDQFATGLVGVRSPYGIPRCVFDADYVSGGSSSGSAVAVARGHVPFALGTDTAGSGRVPAAFNHVVGVKPTRGLLSTAGVVPASRSLDCVSVFAASVAEADHVRRAAQGFDADDPYARSADAVHGLPVAQATLGVLASADREFFGDAHAAALYAHAIETAARLGHALREIDYAPFRDAARLLYGGAWVAERLAALEAVLDADLLDCCAVAVPAGFGPQGLPYGVTLVAPAFRDDDLAVLADGLHRALEPTFGLRRASLPPGTPPGAAAAGTVDLAVVGAHLVGEPLNHELVERGATLVAATHTAPEYRLFALAGTVPPKPGLVREPGFAGPGIAVEVWRLSSLRFGDFVAAVPAPLAIGSVVLADGRVVKGFVCEPFAAAGALDITSHGGWRAWRRARGT